MRIQHIQTLSKTKTATVSLLFVNVYQTVFTQAIHIISKTVKPTLVSVSSFILCVALCLSDTWWLSMQLHTFQ